MTTFEPDRSFKVDKIISELRGRYPDADIREEGDEVVAYGEGGERLESVPVS